jgi:hypothetical protein
MIDDDLSAYEDILQPLIIKALELSPRQISLLTRVFVDARAQRPLSTTTTRVSISDNADVRKQADASLRPPDPRATPRPT